ncbi:short-chain dehydrogenase [Opitutaceae bacterium EW11]|nr:short-chain dehydrogenase [Opitutaceae bacterium EW11]
MAAPLQLPVVFILSISSDIGAQLARTYLDRGATVVGTYRSECPAELAGRNGLYTFRCDVSERESRDRIAEFFERTGHRWDLFVSCVGQLSPIGAFLENDFETWADSVNTNSTAQLRALHAAYPYRHAGQLCHTVFFAGGGTNGPFRSYSAYCLGKIALIKMCELLDDEAPDLNAFIVGTGWVRTKIHEQTLAAGNRAGRNHATTAAFLEDSSKGTRFDEIAAMIDWGVAQGRPVAGGRNFSVVHDGWRKGGAVLAESLRADPNKFKLRRSGNV